MFSRRKARECAVQMLFQWDMGKHPPESVEQTFWSNVRRDEDDAVRQFGGELFRGALEALPQIDAAIRKHAENWRIERMAAVDRNILRLGIYELLHHRETPPAVVINEALELASKFGGEESAPFVNGVLDAVRKDVEATAS